MEGSLETIDDSLLLTKKGQIRKRKPKKSNDYFTEETQAAILVFRASNNQDERDKLYREKIHYAFYKLVENIIHTFKFYYLDSESIEDLKYEVISFLLQKINLYNEDKGKAYSYFGTIVKRYLIVYNKKNYSNKIAKVEVEDIDNENRIIDSLIYEDFSSEIDTQKVVDEFINYVDTNMFELFSSENDLKVAVSIVDLFQKTKDIDEFSKLLINKKLIYIYIKEMVDVPTNSITKVIKRLKTIYKQVLQDHIKKMYY